MSEAIQNLQTSGSNFKFSAVGIDDLGSDSYTVVNIAVDTSSSVMDFEDAIVKTIQQIVEACRKSPRADNLLLRVTTFASTAGNELHGFKELSLCNINDYTSIRTGGSTALYDASYESLATVETMGAELFNKDYDCNGIAIVITDGCDNNSTYGPQSVGEKKSFILREEQGLESFLSILIGVRIQESGVSESLRNFEQAGKFDQYIESDRADAKTLAKLAQFVSQSISSQSQALGTGGASQTIDPHTLAI